MKTKSLFIALAAALGFATSAQAALLQGKTVGYQYHFPAITDIYPSAGNGNHIVGAGIEVLNVAEGIATLDISDTNLYVDYAISATWSTQPFNGFKIYDVLGNIDAFTGVSINAATNLAGLDLSRITFDDNHIWVNWAGLSFNANTVVSLDISGGTSEVPEPASIALIGLGLLGTAVFRRKSVK